MVARGGERFAALVAFGGRSLVEETAIQTAAQPTNVKAK